MMGNFKNMILISFIALLLSSCSNLITSNGGSLRYSTSFTGCPDAEIEWVDMLMIDDIKYEHYFPHPDEGTSIYEIKGYPTSLVVVANDVVYVADRNKKAKTVGELYLMNKLVQNIHIQSTEDGKRLHTFSPSSVDKFLAEFYKLELEDVQSLIDAGKLDGTRIFLEIELNNGVSFRQLYWSDTNTFHTGAIGNDEIEEVIHDEVSNLENEYQ